jgi:hypothetical protein
MTRLSDIGRLDPHAFALLLSLLGEALSAQSSPEDVIERQTGDGLLHSARADGSDTRGPKSSRRCRRLCRP